ncbi:MAG: hypothetical protein ACI857_001421 [Arenicella sp.]|jgi:hypothetical protein
MEHIMELVSIVAAITFQLALIGFLFYGVILGFKSKSRINGTEKHSQILLGILLTAGIFFCLDINLDLRLIETKIGYQDFRLISFIGLLAFWIKKFIPDSKKLILSILNFVIALLFWMSVIASIKLFFFYPYVYFPVLGLILVVPVCLALLTLSNLIYHKNSVNSSFYLIAAFCFLALYTVLHNMWSSEPWELLNWWFSIKQTIF